MRQFQLVNQNGQAYNLINNDSTAFLWHPDGLGFKVDREYMELDGFFFEMSRAESQTPKTGVLVFFHDPYAQYNALMDFIFKSERLRLAYQPESTWYYVDVDIEYIEKSEILEDGTLQCAISMLPTSPMYLPYEINIDLSGDIDANIKQYDYKYAINRELFPQTDKVPNYIGETRTNMSTGDPVTSVVINGETVYPIEGDYVLRLNMGWYYYVGSDNKWYEVHPTQNDYFYVYSNTAVGGEAIIDPIPAQMDSGIEITINGEISAPRVEVFADDEKIGEIDLSSISVSAGEVVKYSSIPTSAGIYRQSGGTVTDITEQIGVNADYPTFFLLPPYKTIKVVLRADTLAGTSASIKVYEYFKSI